MVILLLLVTFVISLLVCFITARLFNKSLDVILNRLIPEDISKSWLRYLNFAMYVVGISAGVRVYQLQQYFTPQFAGEKGEAVVTALTPERWALEIYSTIIGTLSGIAWMLLVFFVVALIAYVIVRIFEAKKHNQQ
ncbi:MAG: hypothetical protein GXY34_14240 [Syntrophomonadaceae bacterium]|nr:hypothetical protein [Syntrophomonadaceae bacterium]